jgi:hypothetical protein
MTKVDRSTVYRCISRLLESGELAVMTEGGGRGKRTIYSLPLIPAETVANCESKPSQNSGETVAKPSHAHTQNADTLTHTPIRNRVDPKKRTPAQVEKDRRYGGESARLPEWTPEYRQAIESLPIVESAPITEIPEVKAQAKKAREAMKALERKKG